MKHHKEKKKKHKREKRNINEKRKEAEECLIEMITNILCKAMIEIHLQD